MATVTAKQFQKPANKRLTIRETRSSMYFNTNKDTIKVRNEKTGGKNTPNNHSLPQADHDRGERTREICFRGYLLIFYISDIFTFQCACSLVKNITWFFFVKRHLTNRRGHVKSWVLIVPFPTFINRICESGHIVHPFIVGNHLEAGDLHSLSRFWSFIGTLS